MLGPHLNPPPRAGEGELAICASVAPRLWIPAFAGMTLAFAGMALVFAGVSGPLLNPPRERGRGNWRFARRSPLRCGSRPSLG